MNTKLATTTLLIGALMVPVFSHAEDKDSDRTHPGAFVADSMITAKIKANMLQDPVVSAMHIKVDTDDKGTVVLSGVAKSQEEMDKAVQIAQNTKGVSGVENHITISANR